jgi:hypothetical protein
MKIRWKDHTIKGTPEEIVRVLRKEIAWDAPETDQAYMHEVADRVLYLYGMMIPIDDPEEFLQALAAIREVKVKEDE